VLEHHAQTGTCDTCGEPMHGGEEGPCVECFTASTAGNPCDTCAGRHPLVILNAGTGCQNCLEHHVDVPDDLTDSLCFTRRQQDILGAALNQIASMGLFPAAEVEELAEQISNA